MYEQITNKKVFSTAYPVFLTLIAQNIINVTDTAFLGRVSEVALGASAIGGVFYIAIFVVGFGFSQGAQILIGRRNGEQNYSHIGPIFNNGLLFNFVLGLLIFGLSCLFIPRAMPHFVTSENICRASLEYLDWRIYGFFFSFLNVMFRGLYVGITKTKVLTVSAIITAGSNIFFDYAMIFGHFGFPAMGIAGAAIASVIAEGTTFIFLLLYTLFVTDVKRYGLFSFRKIDWKIVRQTLSISVFIMFQSFFSISTWFLFFIFIERLGERPLAVTNIGRSLYILMMIPGSALATTVSTLVSNLIGAGGKSQVMPFVNRMVRITLISVIPIMLVTFIYPVLFARIYTADAGLIAATVPVLRIISVAMVCCAVGCIVFSAVSGTGNTRTAFLIETITLLFYIAYIYYTAIIHPSTPAIVWISEFVYWVIVGLLSYCYLRKGNWQKKEI
ncbi:MAG: MATE family efflux transporter [Prevotellaceae bacterium]|jgi:putative MATE family efflux protein|nr:MATE family efflux transporter [Prevotellaceae bacterium]